MEGGYGIGGIVAAADSVKNCINNGDIFAHWGHIHIGGIVGGNAYGHIHTFIDGCVNNGNIEVNKPFNSEGYAIEVGGICANYNRYSERKEFQVINSGNTGNIYIHAECDWYGSSEVRANAISTSNAIQNCFNHGAVLIEGKNGNCFSSIMAPQCENCYTTKNIIIENIDKSFYILPTCYSFGDNSRFCYTPNDFSIEGGTPINDMTAQSFCDLLNANIPLLENKELRNWIQGPDLYPIVAEYKNEEPDMGISEIEINPTDNSTSIYLLNGQKVENISKIPKGCIYIVNGSKYLKISD